MLSTLLSSFLPVYADAPQDDSKDKPEDGGDEESKNEGEGESDKEEGEKGGDKGGDEGGGDAEEEEEAEDEHPVLREECSNSAKCVGFKKHFEHCQEKIEGGEGFKGEDCVEEFMMHCADNCVAPKLFSKLR